jgi:hypothetical protein
MRWPAFLFAALLLAVGCTDAERAAIEAKCDASLRLRIEELAHAGADSLLDVMGRTSGTIDDSHRQKLTSAGARIGQATDDLFTAQIAVKRIGKLASLDFVRSLALSQTREPLSP